MEKYLWGTWSMVPSNVCNVGPRKCVVQNFKVAPYSFSAREEWELNWHKRAREERDSPSQMTCANQPPRRTFPKSD